MSDCNRKCVVGALEGPTQPALEGMVVRGDFL